MAGSYRVDASCERRAVTDQTGTDVDRRDLFTASEVLELTAPAATDNFDVTPPFAPPGAALTVLISGARRCPASTTGAPSTVSGTVIPNAGATGATRSFSATVDANAPEGVGGAFVKIYFVPQGTSVNSATPIASIDAGLLAPGQSFTQTNLAIPTGISNPSAGTWQFVARIVNAAGGVFDEELGPTVVFP